MKQLTKDSIDRYVNDRLPPGGFITAVLTNDLIGAVGKADSENLADLHEICTYIYNSIPSNAWGSKEKMNAWMKS